MLCNCSSQKLITRPKTLHNQTISTNLDHHQGRRTVRVRIISPSVNPAHFWYPNHSGNFFKLSENFLMWQVTLNFNVKRWAPHRFVFPPDAPLLGTAGLEFLIRLPWRICSQRDLDALDLGKFIFLSEVCATIAPTGELECFPFQDSDCPCPLRTMHC